MSKPSLREPFRTLEFELIETFLAGHHKYRPELQYPESHSDMAGGMRAVLQMFEVRRRPLALPQNDLLDLTK